LFLQAISLTADIYIKVYNFLLKKVLGNTELLSEAMVEPIKKRMAGFKLVIGSELLRRVTSAEMGFVSLYC